MWGRSTGSRHRPRPSPEPGGRFRPAVPAGPRLPAVAAGVASAVFLAAWLAAGVSPLFDVRTIRVTGTDHLRRAEVVRLVRAAGIHRGANALWLDGGAAERALGEDPWVARAEVVRDLPGTVRIAVVERRPAARVQVGSTWLLVASDGTVLGAARRGPRLPAIAVPMDSVTVGARPRALAGPARAAAGMGRWLRTRVRTVAAQPDGSLAMNLAGGGRVLFGPPSRAALKDQALAGVIRWAAARHRRLDTVDVRIPAAPAATVAGR